MTDLPATSEDYNPIDVWIKNCDTWQEFKKMCDTRPHAEEYAAAYFNAKLNEACAEWADSAHAKRIPYIGWFWRSVDFYNKNVTIGRGAGIVGFMENNKWDYPEARPTPEQVDALLVLIWSLVKARIQVGTYPQIITRIEIACEAINQWVKQIENFEDR